MDQPNGEGGQMSLWAAAGKSCDQQREHSKKVLEICDGFDENSYLASNDNNESSHDSESLILLESIKNGKKGITNRFPQNHWMVQVGKTFLLKKAMNTCIVQYTQIPMMNAILFQTLAIKAKRGE